MNKTKTAVVILSICALLFSGCATIVGGSKYTAHIVITDKPNAKIFHHGEFIGTGSAYINVKRNEANNLSFTVKEEACGEQKYNYVSRTFRGWAFAGTILTWSYGVGLIMDLATGALWKPNVMEKGVSKENYKNFRYQVNYASCPPPPKPEIAQELLDVLYLKSGSIVRGTILEQIPGVQVKLQNKEGNVYVYKAEEIEKITRELTK